MKFATSTILFFLLAHIALGQYEFVSPKSGSEYHNPETTIILRTGETIDVDVMEQTTYVVVGNESGNHAVRPVLSDDRKTVILYPETAFLPGENVHVNVSNGLSDLELNFNISSKTLHSEYPSAQLETEETQPPYLGNRGGVPANFPTLTVNANTNPSPGKIFFNNNHSTTSANRFISIVDNAWVPEFYIQNNSDGQCFTINKNGYLTYQNRPGKQFYMLDSAYQLIDSFAAGNGYDLNGHEFLIWPNGDHEIMIYDEQIVDMSVIVSGGNPNALVTGLVFQRLDANHNVVFQWRSWDYFQITDAQNVTLTNSNIDYVHGNSIEVDSDGHYLVSCRGLDEVTKINSSTGDIIWRWGGLNNEFTFINDPIGFSAQHDVRRQANGNITLFDNGKFHTVQKSYAREYMVDEVAKTATLVWSYEHPVGVYGRAMGNVQRLPNGNTFINWGWVNTGESQITEVQSDCTMVYDATFDDSQNRIYRANRFMWQPTVSSIAEQIDQFEVMVYPNPANDLLNLNFELQETETLSIACFDFTGKQILSIPASSFAVGNHRIPINISGLSDGLYHLRISSGNVNITRKIIIAKG
jgi:hypothetical protein